MNIGDYAIVTLKDDIRFEGLLVAGDPSTIMTFKVLSEGLKHRTSALPLYGLKENEGILVDINSCKEIAILSSATKFKTKNSTYYRTKVNEGYYTCCINEYGEYGWSQNANEKAALQESYSNSGGTSNRRLLTELKQEYADLNDFAWKQWSSDWSKPFEHPDNYKIQTIYKRPQYKKAPTYDENGRPVLTDTGKQSYHAINYYEDQLLTNQRDLKTITSILEKVANNAAVTLTNTDLEALLNLKIGRFITSEFSNEHNGKFYLKSGTPKVLTSDLTPEEVDQLKAAKATLEQSIPELTQKSKIIDDPEDPMSKKVIIHDEGEANIDRVSGGKKPAHVYVSDSTGKMYFDKPVNNNKDGNKENNKDDNGENTKDKKEKEADNGPFRTYSRNVAREKFAQRWADMGNDPRDFLGYFTFTDPKDKTIKDFTIQLEQDGRIPDEAFQLAAMHLYNKAPVQYMNGPEMKAIKEADTVIKNKEVGKNASVYRMEPAKYFDDLGEIIDSQNKWTFEDLFGYSQLGNKVTSYKDIGDPDKDPNNSGVTMTPEEKENYYSKNKDIRYNYSQDLGNFVLNYIDHYAYKRWTALQDQFVFVDTVLFSPTQMKQHILAFVEKQLQRKNKTDTKINYKWLLSRIWFGYKDWYREARAATKKGFKTTPFSQITGEDGLSLTDDGLERYLSKFATTNSIEIGETSTERENTHKFLVETFGEDTYVTKLYELICDMKGTPINGIKVLDIAYNNHPDWFNSREDMEDLHKENKYKDDSQGKTKKNKKSRLFQVYSGTVIKSFLGLDKRADYKETSSNNVPNFIPAARMLAFILDGDSLSSINPLKQASSKKMAINSLKHFLERNEKEKGNYTKKTEIDYIKYLLEATGGSKENYGIRAQLGLPESEASRSKLLSLQYIIKFLKGLNLTTSKDVNQIVKKVYSTLSELNVYINTIISSKGTTDGAFYVISNIPNGERAVAAIKRGLADSPSLANDPTVKALATYFYACHGDSETQQETVKNEPILARLATRASGQYKTKILKDFDTFIEYCTAKGLIKSSLGISPQTLHFLRNADETIKKLVTSNGLTAEDEKTGNVYSYNNQAETVTHGVPKVLSVLFQVIKNYHTIKHYDTSSLSKEDREKIGRGANLADFNLKPIKKLSSAGWEKIIAWYQRLMESTNGETKLILQWWASQLKIPENGSLDSYSESTDPIVKYLNILKTYNHYLPASGTMNGGSVTAELEPYSDYNFCVIYKSLQEDPNLTTLVQLANDAAITQMYINVESKGLATLNNLLKEIQSQPDYSKLIAQNWYITDDTTEEPEFIDTTIENSDETPDELTETELLTELARAINIVFTDIVIPNEELVTNLAVPGTKKYEKTVNNIIKKVTETLQSELSGASVSFSKETIKEKVLAYIEDLDLKPELPEEGEEEE